MSIPNTTSEVDNSSYWVWCESANVSDFYIDDSRNLAMSNPALSFGPEHIEQDQSPQVIHETPLNLPFFYEQRFVKFFRNSVVGLGKPKHQADRLASLASDCVNSGKRFKIDPRFLLSISIIETGWGTSKTFLEKNNAMGISTAGGVSSQQFNAVIESIDYMADRLRSSTYGGANTIFDIGLIYSPPPTVVEGKLCCVRNDVACNDQMKTGSNGYWIPSVTKIFWKYMLPIEVA